MTVEQAKQKLEFYRKKQRGLRKKIDALRAFLRSKNIDPDKPKVDLTLRNNAIYSRYLDGLSWADIAAEFKLSKERVRELCKRVEAKNERKARQEQESE